MANIIVQCHELSIALNDASCVIFTTQKKPILHTKRTCTTLETIVV